MNRSNELQNTQLTAHNTSGQLFDACKRGDLQEVKNLLAQGLRKAHEKELQKVFKEFIHKYLPYTGANVNEPLLSFNGDGRDANRPILIAAANGHTEVVNALLNHPNCHVYVTTNVRSFPHLLRISIYN